MGINLEKLEEEALKLTPGERGAVPLIPIAEALARVRAALK